MAQPATNPKIEELRFRLKTDPKSRLFYQLAEELRRGGQFAEAEQILRQGLVAYPTYLAAWVSLGRALRDQRKDAEAVDALNTALQHDPGNVVAARLLADAYLALGEKVEAIKKYKLVHAILPMDEELRGTIERLERELHPPAVSVFEPEFEPDSEVQAAEQSPEAVSAFAFADENAMAETTEVPLPVAAPAASVPASGGDARDAFTEDSPFDKTVPPFSLDDQPEGEPAGFDDEPMAGMPEESPFEEPEPSALADAVASETPVGIEVDFSPPSPETPAPQIVTEVEEADVFAPGAPAAAGPRQEVTDTLTMADLYARQGLVEDAKTIYQHLLVHDPDNLHVREKLAALTLDTPAPRSKVERLERWLGKVAKREVGGV